MKDERLCTFWCLHQRALRMIKICDEASKKNKRPAYLLGIVRENLVRQEEELRALVDAEEKKEKGDEAKLGQG